MTIPSRRRRFRFPFRSRAAVQADIREEFQFHLDMRTAELVSTGLSESEARALAVGEFGDRETGARACARHDDRVETRRHVSILVEEIRRDVALAVRMLARSPGFTLVAVLSFALGIGANTAIYSMVEQMLLRPLPVAHPEELVNLGAPGPKPGFDQCNQSGSCDEVFSYPMFKDLEAAAGGVASLAAHRGMDVTLSGGSETVNGWSYLVSGSYFQVLGLTPTLGRLIGPQDDALGLPPVVVLSHEYWRRAFAGDPGVLDRTLIVNGKALTVVGVGPEGFVGTTLGSRAQLFMPVASRPALEIGFDGLDNRRGYWMYAFARLKPGVTAQAAKATLDGIYRNILSDVEAPLQVGMSDETMARFKAREVTVTGGSQGQSQLRASVSTPLVLLMVVAGVVLLVACANIANLLLVRSAGRTGEMAVRLSVGGSRGQIVRQLLTESAVLAAAGGLAGVFVARWTLVGVAALLPEEMAAMVGPTVGTPAIVFAIALSLVTGLAAGLLPAIHSTRPDLASTLKSQAGQPSGARAAARFRTTLATAQIGLAMALLVAAGLFTRSLINVSQVDLGMDVDHVLTFGLAPGFNGYEPDRTRTFIERAEADLAALPGVTSASASLIRVLSGNSNGGNLRVEGFDAGPDTNVNVRLHHIGADFFRTLRMPVLAGRAFSVADADEAPKVAIVNEAFARKFNLGSNPIGKRLSLDRRAATLDTEIVGFVRDAKYSAVKQDVPAVLFLPYRQEKELFGAFFYARTSVPPESVMSSIGPLAANLDPDIPVWSAKLLEQQVRENIFLDRLIGVLSASFAGLATLLAAIGLYGVLAYTIAQRTREIGLRMALGADAARVRGMILGQVARMAAVGGGVGLVVAIGIGLWAQSLLFELDGHDPAVIAAAVVILGAVALFAGFVPARRASRIEPMRALKWE